MTTAIARFVFGVLLVVLFVLAIAAADGLGEAIASSLSKWLR